MPEKRFVTICSECKHFKPFAEPDYGECMKKMFRGAILKTTDYCSYAELPLPEHDDHTVSGLLDD